MVWETERLGDLASFRNGVNYSKENFGHGIRVINVKDFQDYSSPKYETLSQINPEGAVSNAHHLQSNDIVFVRSNGNRNLIGRSMLIERLPEEPITHSAFSIRLRFDDIDTIDPKFYFYFLRSGVIRQILSAHGNGANISNLNQDILSRLEVPLPPLPIQRRIAGILSAYDELIEVNTRRIKALEEMAHRTYEDWIEHCGEVPTAKLTEIAELTMGQSPKSEFYNEDGEGMPFHQGVTNFGTLYPKHKLFSTAGNREAEEDDILFSVRAPVGRINIAPSKMILGRGLAAIRSKNNAQAFLLSALKHEFSEEDKIGNGAIFKAVTKSDMQNITLPNPPEDELQKVECIFKSYWKQIGNLVKQNTNLRAQRDLLVPRLVSGEIDVSDAEQTLEAAE